MRMKELMARLLDKAPDLELFAVGTVPSWVYREPPSIPVARREVRCDVGAVQSDSVHLDVARTIEENKAFYRGIGGMVKREAEFIRSRRIDLVVGDIPPLAFLASSSAGVSSVAVGNFSWDWIYEGYAGEHPDAAGLVDLAREAYGRADRLLRLPFHGDMDAFRSVIDIPLIARRAASPPGLVRSRLGIPAGEKRKVIFISMGGHGRPVIGEGASADFGDYLYVSYFRPAAQMENLIILDDRARVPHPDLVRACDAVISKPGYCTVAECIANRTPIIYTSRDNFREFPIMESAVRRFCRWNYMPREEFEAGAWRRALDEYFSSRERPSPADIAVDGAERAAGIILNMLR